MPKPPIVLLTRPAAESRRFAGLLGGSTNLVIAPVFEILPRLVAVDLKNYAALIFSSRNAVNSLAGQQDLKGLTGFAVGDRTADLARAGGMDITSAKGDAHALVATVLSKPPTGKLLYLHGMHTRGDVADRLQKGGLVTDSIVVYDQLTIPLPSAALQIFAENRRVVLPIFSSRSAELLSAALADIDVRAQLTLIAMSPTVAAAWREPPLNETIVVQQPTEAEMLTETLRRIGSAS